jgi:hypothetical protein
MLNVLLAFGFLFLFTVSGLGLGNGNDNNLIFSEGGEEMRIKLIFSVTKSKSFLSILSNTFV